MSPIDNKNYLIPDVLMNEINDLDNPNSIEMYEINLEDSKNLSTDIELTGNLMKIYEKSVNSNVIIASNNVVDKFKINKKYIMFGIIGGLILFMPLRTTKCIGINKYGNNYEYVYKLGPSLGYRLYNNITNYILDIPFRYKYFE